MKLPIATAAFVLAAAPLFTITLTTSAYAQSELTGVSKPDSSEITASQDAPPVKPAKPAAAIAPLPASATSTEVYGPYVPYRAPGTLAPTAPVATTAFDPDAHIITSVDQAPAQPDQATLDAGIVTEVPERDGELRAGTLLKTRMKNALSTTSTVVGTAFTADLIEPVTRSGKVILPIGSVLEGMVTDVHSGRRISGAASLHLVPRSVTLPDGTHYILHAQLIDTSQTAASKVNSEGTLVRRDHPKETLAVMSLAAGGGAAAGALVGGGVGAVVGAGVGAGVGTVIWLKQDRQENVAKDSTLVFSLTVPMILKPLSAAANFTISPTISSTANSTADGHLAGAAQ